MTLTAFCIGLLSVAVAAGMTDHDSLAAGEKMYRAGILPSGLPMQASVQGGAPVPGSTYACVSCHTKSGIGGMAEGLRTLPINGPRLYQPLYPNFQAMTTAERKKMLPERYQSPPVRPAYNDTTLGAAIRDGVDPNGRLFNPVMPRYELSDPDLGILINYLKHLSAKPSPGVTDSVIALATVITGEVSPEDRDAMLNTLEWGIKSHNNLGRNSGDMGVMLSMQEMRLGHREWSLAKWILNGPPETWPAQLEQYYAKSPVFALVGGISNLPWAPVHQFCETRQIPCILPLTDLPVISSTDYYTLYFTKGYYQEGEAVARSLDKSGDPKHPLSIIQILSPGPEAQALALGFQNTWSSLGHGMADTITVKDGGPAAGDLLAKSAGKGAGSVCLLWTGPESYDALKSLAGRSKKPGRVFMSAARLGGKIWELPSKARAFTYLTYSFRDPGPTPVIPKMGGKPKIVNKEFRKNDRRIASKTGTLVDILNDRLIAIERNFYRDHLIDLFETMMDQSFTDYPSLVFNPGQNYASESCSIMKLSPGPDPKLVRQGE